jgi:hypothetical protein
MVCRAVGERLGQRGQHHDQDVAVAGVVAEAGGAVLVVEVLGQVGAYPVGRRRLDKVCGLIPGSAAHSSEKRRLPGGSSRTIRVAHGPSRTTRKRATPHSGSGGMVDVTPPTGPGIGAAWRCRRPGKRPKGLDVWQSRHSLAGAV